MWHMPESDRLIAAAAEDCLAIGRETEIVDPTLMPNEFKITYEKLSFRRRAPF